MPTTPVNTRINIQEVAAEFGQYIETNMKDVFTQILYKTNIERFMRTIPNVRGIFKMTTSHFEEITQPFQKNWTPKGGVAFKPEEIQMRRMKIDFPWNVDDLFDSWLAWMYDQEGKDRKDLTISRFILSEVLRKAQEERSLIAVNGVYAEPTIGTAGDALDSADGILKILNDFEANTKSNLIETVSFDTNPFDAMLGFIRGMKPESIRRCQNRVFADVSLIYDIVDDYEANNQNKSIELSDNDGIISIKIPKTPVTVVGIEEMNSKRVFATPQNNFLRLIDQVQDIGKFDVESEKRNLNLLVDYSAAWGFGSGNFVWSNVLGTSSGEGEGE